jgi:hypothetical protein
MRVTNFQAAGRLASATALPSTISPVLGVQPPTFAQVEQFRFRPVVTVAIEIN